EELVLEGKMVNSGFLDGLASGEARGRMTAWLEANRKGSGRVNYKLRDWLFSRQRYWGEPIPIVWVSEEDYRRAAEARSGDLPAEPVAFVDGGRTRYALP